MNLGKGNDVALVGYARVSSVGQSLEVQLDKLKHCDTIYQEKKSGASGRRPRLEACLKYIREGDTLGSLAWIGWRVQRFICARLPPISNASRSTSRCCIKTSTPIVQPVACCSTCSAQSL